MSKAKKKAKPAKKAVKKKPASVSPLDDLIPQGTVLVDAYGGRLSDIEMKLFALGASLLGVNLAASKICVDARLEIGRLRRELEGRN